jgi:hypothetical protein
MVEDLGVVSESTAVIQSSAVVGAASLPELMHGEQLAVDISARVGRTNRSRVKVRVIGNASLTWVDLVYQWGGLCRSSCPLYCTINGLPEVEVSVYCHVTAPGCQVAPP